MENISENKRKRGRPLKVLADGRTVKESMRLYEAVGLFDEVKSERAKINKYYMVRAQSALKDENGGLPVDGIFSFIISGNHLESFTFKQTILQELGRLEDDELIRKVAKDICDYKLPTAKAIVYIRQFRREKKPGDSLQLAVELLNKIEEYEMKHVDVDTNLLLSALEITKNVITEKISENE